MQRQKDLKARIPRLREDLQISAMVLSHDPVRDLQSHTGPISYPFRREEWLEDAILDLRRDAGAVVRDLDQDVIALKRRAQRDTPASFQRVDRVVDQVRPHLI